MRTENGSAKEHQEKKGRSISTEGQSSGLSTGRSYECVSLRPDGGLAWVMVLASFVSIVIIDHDREKHFLSLY